MRCFDRLVACGLLVLTAVAGCGGTKKGSRAVDPPPASARGEGGTEGAAAPSGAAGSSGSGTNQPAGGAAAPGAGQPGGEPSDGGTVLGGAGGGGAGAGGESGAGGAGGGNGGGAGAGDPGMGGGAGGSATGGAGGAGGSGGAAGGGGPGGAAGGSSGAGGSGGDAAAGSDASPSGAPDANATADAAAPDPAGSCGGVLCPALFALVDSCRPQGMCSLAQQGISGRLCYENGIKVVAVPDLLGGKQILTWTKADGVTPCYSVETPIGNPGGIRTFVWRTPAGAVVATGQMGPAGESEITCGGVTAPLADESCVSVPSPADCTPGVCP